MSNGLFIPAAGMMAEDVRADVIANNLANVRTAGFRKDFATFRSRLMKAQQHGMPGQAAPGLILDGTAWDREPGPAEITGRPLDLAIQGEGWFSVQRGGRTFYTRAGNFQVNAAGRLSTADGKGEVLSNGGGPISLTGVTRFEVNGNGEVVGPEGVIATLGVTTFDHPEALVKSGDSLFENPGAAGPRTASNVEVVSGALEQASVEPVREMVSMIAAFRAYEMNAEALRMMDQMAGRAANDVGKLNG